MRAAHVVVLVCGVGAGLGCGASSGDGDSAADTDSAPDADSDAVSEVDADTRSEVDADERGDAEDSSEVTSGLDDNFGVLESEGDASCDNLDPSHCLFPFPSDRFRVAASGGTEAHLSIGTAGPRDAAGVPMNAAGFDERDGWSPMTPVVFSLPDMAWPRPVYVDHQPFDVAASLDAASPTVVLDATTGHRVAHWVELDHFARADGVAIAFLRFPKPLAFGTRYVVAVRGVRDTRDALIAPSPGFAALRDGTASTTRGVHTRRAHFEEAVFPLLSAAAIPRETLQLAWDFTTASEADTTAFILTMRDRLYAAIGEDGPEYVVDENREPGEDGIGRMVLMTVKVPSFLEAPDANGVRRVRRDAEGLPAISGTESVAVEIQIPNSVLFGKRSAEIVEYGHGLFWSREEARKDWLRETAEREGFIVVGLDTQGMSESEIGAWGGQLSADLGGMTHLTEWPAQGIMNQLAVQRLLRGRLKNEVTMTADGLRLYDPSRITYYGNSQGGTLGATMMALTRDTRYGVLGVPGCAFSQLIHKSVGFSGFSELIHIFYPDPYDFAAVLGLVQTAFDRVEPLNLVRHLLSTTAPDVPRTVLLQVAKEDATVDNQVSFVCGRTYGATLLEPAVRPVWGLGSGLPPQSGNTLTEWDFGHPDNPDPWAPAPRETDTHEDLRRLRRAQDQWTRFIRTGVVTHACDGVCDPE